MKCKRELINRIHMTYGRFTDLQALCFSPDRKIDIQNCLPSEQDFKKKERSICIKQASKLLFPRVSHFRIIFVCDI